MEDNSALSNRRKPDYVLVGAIIMMAFGYVLIHSLLGGTLFKPHYWDSYTLQAMAWREGRLDLGQNYEYLELAIYNGQYFVSFPPVPSVVMLPLTFFFGYDTPCNLVVAVYAVFSFVLSYKILRLSFVKDVQSACIAMLLVWGSNMMWMSTNGGVWFQAQALNMLLCLAAVYAALKHKRILAYAFLALAVGCRPFSLLYFPALFLYFYVKDSKSFPQIFFLKKALKQAKCVIVPIVIAAAYMAYNYARFDNPLEFGHNYLPEFTGAAHGQFSFTYLWDNLYNLFIRPVALNADGVLTYPVFDGFMFYIANPFFILLGVKFVSDIVKKRFNAVKAALVIAMLFNILLLCVHKTLGGWQFGARYTVDLLPFALMYMVIDKRWSPKRWEMFLCVLGVMFNVYGAVAMHFLYS